MPQVLNSPSSLPAAQAGLGPLGWKGRPSGWQTGEPCGAAVETKWTLRSGSFPLARDGHRQRFQQTAKEGRVWPQGWRWDSGPSDTAHLVVYLHAGCRHVRRETFHGWQAGWQREAKALPGIPTFCLWCCRKSKGQVRFKSG